MTRRSRSYLVIHLPRRGTVEAYRPLRHGPRLSAVAVAPRDDCAVVECRGPYGGGGVGCYLLERADDGSYAMDKLVIDDPDDENHSDAVDADGMKRRVASGQTSSSSYHGGCHTGGGSTGMQLTLLRQLLAPDTEIRCDARTVLATYRAIRSLSDLGEGLDALSRCDRPLERTTRSDDEDGGERGGGGEGGDPWNAIHSRAIAHCKSRLDDARDRESHGGSDSAAVKVAVRDLASRVSYHDRLAGAYDELRRYEARHYATTAAQEGAAGDVASGDGGGTYDCYEEGIMGTTMAGKRLSPWASEALAWTSVAYEDEAVRARFSATSCIIGANGPYGDDDDDGGPISFSDFASACRSSSNGEEERGGDDDSRAYLTKVKRNRLPVLRRIFRPLLQDLFVFKVVNAVFGKLGMNDDRVALQRYFGEWCDGTLPTRVVVESNVVRSEGTWRPMVRWLQDLILSAYETSQLEHRKSGHDALKKHAKLDTLLKFCMDMEDLPKAFLLAVICMEAVSSASAQLEQKTYGEITQLECVRPWEDLLRKLRVCLLVTLRLGGDVSPILGGADPMTVSNISRPNIFSAYSWIARDELCLTHDCRLAMALEDACLSSSHAFHPSGVDGDGTQNVQTIFQSCVRFGGSPDSPAGLADDAHSPRPLLFYLKDQARFTTRLAANRALILAAMWGRSPRRLDLLKHAVSALQVVVDHIEVFSLATLVEIYQSRFRPVCRAMLFGFGEHELSEEAVSPLIDDQSWLLEFVAATKRILSMTIECMSRTPVAKSDDLFNSSGKIWPPLRECPVLDVLVKKLRTIQPSSVELHHTVILAFEMTRSVDSLQLVVPSFSNLFLTGSIFSEMQPIASGSPEQRDLLDEAILDQAKSSTSPVVDNFSSCRSCELFGKSLGVDVKYVRTRYLIEMIRLGKDPSIDALLGASISSLDGAFFAEKIVEIVCTRHHATILSLKRTKNYRGILSLLDADASRWVKGEAAKYNPSQKNSNASTSLITTHSLVTRVQNMSESLDDSISEKVDALCLMSSTLLNAVQAQEQEAVMSV